MEALGFRSIRCSTIHSLQRSMRASVLINGSPSEEFSFTNGVRQGDPLSPSLFNLVGEVFHVIMKKACDKGVIEGLRLQEDSDMLSYLQFTDDTIVFLKGSERNIRNFKCLLKCFQLTTGLKVNFNKSAIYSPIHPLHIVKNWENILECVVGSFPLTYLGAQLGINSAKKVYWKPLNKKVNEKLASWKSNSLNIAGRSTLIKSIINSIPIYWFGLNRIPKGTLREVDKRRRRFFWNELTLEEEGKRRLHTIN